MRSLYLFILIAFSATKFTYSNRIALHSKLINDIISHENLRAIFVGKVCWTLTQQLEFAKITSRPVAFLKKSNEIPKIVGADQNTIWFFVDMMCDDSLEFLQTVNEFYFSHPFRWIFVDGEESVLMQFPFLPDSNIIVTKKMENGKYNLTQG